MSLSLTTKTEIKVLRSTVDTQPAMDVHGLSIGYGSQYCLCDVNLRIPANRITAIVGPSGCGKSSFLSSLNRTGELQSGWKSEGEVSLFQQSIFSGGYPVRELRRRVGMISQRPNPFPFSIRKNIELGLREHGFPKKEWNQIIEKKLREVGLWEEVSSRLDRSALQLSGGQQQRLCIARAMALRPSILLFDEPCSALDPVSTTTIENLLARLKESATVVIVTHNLAQARRVADQVAMFWYEDGVGKLVEVAPTEEFFENPKHSGTKQFLTGVCG